MVITILAEPRSGSTNLINWFINKKEFTILKEPITSPEWEWYKNGVSPKLWTYKTPHLIIKEIYHPSIDFSELMEISDKIIILYRENKNQQSESWLNANKTNNWDKPWIFKKELIENEDTTFFNTIKDGIKRDYLDKNYFNISYEELYYNNAFQKIVDYINLDTIKNKNFPYGKKYRINANRVKTLI
jgi:hypothetical protein